MDRAAVGRRGEDAVAALLEGRGFSIVGRNVKVGRLELDLIARRRDLLVVCEVRARTSETFGTAVESIGPQKVRRVRQATARWLVTEGRTLGRVRLRFDAAGVLLDRDGQVVKLEYYEDAF